MSFGLSKTLDFIYQNPNDNSLIIFGENSNTYEIHCSVSALSQQSFKLTFLDAGGKNYHSNRVLSDGNNFIGYYVFGNPGMF